MTERAPDDLSLNLEDCDGTYKSKCPQNTETSTSPNFCQLKNEIRNTNEYNEAIEDIPPTLQVCAATRGYQLQHHLQEKHERENLSKKYFIHL